MSKASRRVRCSRWLAKRILGREEMLSALADAHGWRCRHVIDLLFIWQGKGHCANASDWEAFSRRPEGFVERARRDWEL